MHSKHSSLALKIKYLAFSLIMLLSLSCKPKNPKEGELLSLSAPIVLVGNAPFARLALETKEGRLYLSFQDQKDFEYYLSKQGNIVEIKGYFHKNIRRTPDHSYEITEYVLEIPSGLYQEKK